MDAQWTRNMPWHQGAVLPRAAIQDTGLMTDTGQHDEICIMVISHDCDLANHNLDQEPDVELIIGRRLERGQGNYYWAKSPRTLHLDALYNGKTSVIELVATARRAVPKRTLACFTPDESWVIPPEALSALRSWLAVRYNRSAFPDPFVEKLSQTKLADKLNSLMKSDGKDVSAVYFGLGGGSQHERGDEAAYELTIVLAFVPGEDPEATQAHMDNLADRIRDAFEKKLFDSNTNTWRDIRLKDCMALSEDDMTLSQARRLQQWRLDYLSIRGGEGHAAPVA